MRPYISRVISKIHEAGLSSDAWPDTLKTLTDELGIAGAAAHFVTLVCTRRSDAVWKRTRPKP